MAGRVGTIYEENDRLKRKEERLVRDAADAALSVVDLKPGRPSLLTPN